MAGGFFDTSLSQLKRIPKELSANIADLVKTYGPTAAKVGVESLPGAGLVQAPQDYGEAAKRFSQGDYAGAGANFLQGLYNQGSEMIPGGAMLPTMAMAGAMPTMARQADNGVSRLVAPSGKAIDPPAGTAAGSVLPDDRIAQRIPWVKGTDPSTGATQDLRINTETMRSDPKYWDKITGEEGLRGVIPDKVMTSADPEERAGAAKELMTSNLRQLYERQDPAIRERAIQWYPGGNKISGEIAEQIGVPRSAAAGAIAALSPQTDWFQNVEMAKRLAATYGEDPLITQQMLDRFRSAPGVPGLRAASSVLDQHVGRRFSDLEDYEAGIAGVAHDFETRGRGYPILGPEGGQMGQQMTQKGNEGQLGWQNTTNLEKAMSALRSGGDRQTISDAMGTSHKVRNFYNNLAAPSGAYDDYTSDTHNVAAALLRPLAGVDPEVGVGLGMSGPKSGRTGAKGLYGMYADAGRELAKEYGVAPYQIQSPTWEGVRALFPKEAKNATNKKAVNDIWEQYRTGAIPLDEAQNRVFDYAGRKMKGDVNKVPWR